MDDFDRLLSVEKASDWLRIEPGVTGNFLLGHSVVASILVYLSGGRVGVTVSVRGETVEHRRACLVKELCPPGTVLRCEDGGAGGRCELCPPGTWQSDWGQVRCRDCPANTSTVSGGARSVGECRDLRCGQVSSHNITVLSSPNFPSSLPPLASCSWTVLARAGSAGLVVVLPSLSLPDNCSHSLSVVAGQENLLTSCHSLPSPRLLTTSSLHLTVSLSPSATSSSSSSLAAGFQMTVVSVPREMQAVLEVMTGAGTGAEIVNKIIRTIHQLSGGAGARGGRNNKPVRPLLEVTRERKEDFVVVERRN